MRCARTAVQTLQPLAKSFTRCYASFLPGIDLDALVVKREDVLGSPILAWIRTTIRHTSECFSSGWSRRRRDCNEDGKGIGSESVSSLHMHVISYT